MASATETIGWDAGRAGTEPSWATGHSSRLAAGTYVSVLLLVILHLALLRDGHGWGDDFAMYLHHAKNIVEGTPYAETGYLYNPHLPSLGPRTYPPMYPLLLAPVYQRFGLDLRAFKIELVVFFAAFVLLAAAILRRSLPPLPAFLAWCLFAWSPYFIEATNAIGADIPFAALCCAFVLLAPRPSFSRHHLAIQGLVLGVILYSAAAMRTVGWVLLPSLIAFDVARRRTIAPATLVAGAVAVGLAAAQGVVLGIDRSYLDQLGFSVRYAVVNARSYPWTLLAFVSGGASAAIDGGMTVILWLMAAGGFARRVLPSRRVGVEETFTVAYGIAILLWPSRQGPRFLIPLAPFIALYVATAAVALARHSRLAGRLGLALWSVIVLFHVAQYIRLDRRPTPEGVGDPEFRACLGYILGETPPGSRMVFRKPRLLSLYTGRAASAYHQAAERDFWEYFEGLGATHIVVDRSTSTDPSEEREKRYLMNIVRRSARLRTVYDNGRFAVHEILPRRAARSRLAEFPARSCCCGKTLARSRPSRRGLASLGAAILAPCDLWPGSVLAHLLCRAQRVRRPGRRRPLSSQRS
jgi:hypothetical protein